MNRLLIFPAIGAISLATLHAAEESWRALLDEKLSGWEKWLGVPHASVKDLPEGVVPAAGEKGKPLGLNVDPKNVFSVKIEDGEPVLRVSGEIWGGLTTLESFSSYHFRAQVKWGEAKWEPRKESVRDNGICYHCTGPHGVASSFWKKSLEFQVQEKDMGDFWQVGGTRADIRAVKKGDKCFFDPAGEILAFGEKGAAGSVGPSAAHLQGDFEKPHGEWNTLDLYVVGREAVHVVNGKVVMAIQNSSTLNGSEKSESPLSSGQIQIQSESAECFWRRIEIRPITEFPAEIRAAAALK